MIRKAGPQEEIGYVSQSTQPEEKAEETVEPAAEIGSDSQPAPLFRNSATRPRPEHKLETMSDAEAFDFLDKLTTPPAPKYALSPSQTPEDRD
jgi:hypothetical protein